VGILPTIDAISMPAATAGPGFNVSGDITPELSNDQATALVASVMAAWIDGLRPGVPADRKAAAATTLATFVANGTAGIATPWLLASAMENTQWY